MRGNTQTKIGLVVVASLSVGAWAGLLRPHLPGRVQGDNASKLLRKQTPGSGEKSAPPGQVLLEHDFGLVLPNQQREHSFPISNSSSSSWTFAAIRTTCSCTVSSPSNLSIPAGGIEHVAVRYRAPNDATDDSRSVTVEFREPKTPLIVLRIRAKVRDTLNLSKTRLEFRADASAAAGEDHFDVCNYGTSDWVDLRASMPVAWLGCTLSRQTATTGSGTGTPRQVWHAIVTPDMTKVGSGSQGATIRITALHPDGTSEHRDIVIEIANEPPIRTIPSQLFFGEIAAGSTVRKELLVKANIGPTSLASASVRVRHTLSSEFDWTCEMGKSPDQWRFVGRLTPRATTRRISGDVSLAIAGHEVRIPVIATVSSAVDESRHADD